MDRVLLPILAFAFALSSLLALVLSPKRRHRLLGRLVRRRSSSGESTPIYPPDAKTETEPETEKPAVDQPTIPPNYNDIFPPSRRDALRDIYPTLPASLTDNGNTPAHALILAHGPHLLDEKRPNPRIPDYVPLGVPSDDLPGNLLSPTGFTLDEIRQLGDFPAYDALSGVPRPRAYEGFDVDRARPRPYRPFRWRYHQTMSLTKLEPDWWLELESTYRARITQRKALRADGRHTVLQYLPGSELACKELMEMALSFLCDRYPHYFSLELEGPGSGSGSNAGGESQAASPRRIFRNAILGTATDLRSLHPLEVLLENVPEDFAIMQRDPRDGGYYLRAGVICSALGWSVGTKIGKRLHEVHAPVPDYREKMMFSMDRFFAKMPTNRPIQRGSWGLEIDQPLFVPPDSPALAGRSEPLPNGETVPLDRLHLRVDWQTLRRLPLTGAIVFNFKAVFTPLKEFRGEPGVPALVLKVLREGKGSIMEYKGTGHVRGSVEGWLEEWKREQVESGMVDAGWREETLEESPFCRGWEGRWREAQGF